MSAEAWLEGPLAGIDPAEHATRHAGQALTTAVIVRRAR